MTNSKSKRVYTDLSNRTAEQRLGHRKGRRPKQHQQRIQPNHAQTLATLVRRKRILDIANKDNKLTCECFW